MTAEEKCYTAIGQQMTAAQQSQMFGKPCLKINGKAFASFFDNEMVFKLSGAAHSEAISLPGARAFDPSGKRPMKEWVQVPGIYAEKWSRFAKAAMEYVAAKEAGSGKK